MTLTFLTRNLLEEGTVAALAAPGFPGTRLYDRDRGPQWQADAVALRGIVLDLGVGNALPASGWALVNHNVVGSVTVLKSANGVDFTTVDSANVTGINPFVRSFAQDTSRYWTIQIPGGSVEARIGELLLGGARALTTKAKHQGVRREVVGNVRRDLSPAGHAWRVELGESRMRLRYRWDLLPDADRLVIEQAFAEADAGAKSFMVLDEDGVPRWVEFEESELRFTLAVPGFWEFDLSLLEAL